MKRLLDISINCYQNKNVKIRYTTNTEKTLKNQFLIALAAGYSKEERVEKLVRGMAKDLLCSYDDARG